MNHNNNFNFLRIFAAVLVCITHSYAVTGNAISESLHQITNGYFYLSSVGLYIFFFTSGYLVSYSAATSKSPRIYLQKRALRIYPALVIVVLLSVFIAGPLLTTYSSAKYFTAADTWKYLWTATGLRIRFRLPGVFETPLFAMTGFNGSLWSIKLELELYALLLVLMVSGILKKRRLLLTLLSILIIGCVLLNIGSQHFILIPDHKNLLLACSFLFGGIMQTKFISKKYAIYLLTGSGTLLFARLTGLIRINIM
ncbi:MAG: acyltransferase family protein, partial [Ginsengibacter sp.]